MPEAHGGPRGGQGRVGDIGVGDSITTSTVHRSTYHQFKVIALQSDIECGFVTCNDSKDFRTLIDNREGQVPYAHR